ncbi:MAG: hypothetical protein A2X93_03000 [Deltaproteobacteria bacterium GWC2_56_8]|nr:MAG: hypothetical protein A2X93_03000 [Deltaproteobacteria bacterium GWC2_56_8]
MGRYDAPLEAVLGRLGKEPGVVYVGVGHENIIQFSGVEGEYRPVEVVRAAPLVHPALDEYLEFVYLDVVAGARDRRRPARECKPQKRPPCVSLGRKFNILAAL